MKYKRNIAVVLLLSLLFSMLLVPCAYGADGEEAESATAASETISAVSSESSSVDSSEGSSEDLPSVSSESSSVGSSEDLPSDSSESSSTGTLEGPSQGETDGNSADINAADGLTAPQGADDPISENETEETVTLGAIPQNASESITENSVSEIELLSESPAEGEAEESETDEVPEVVLSDANGEVTKESLSETEPVAAALAFSVSESTEELSDGGTVHTFLVSSSAPSFTPVDIVFVIDSTGSMSDEISNVRNNLNTFAESLDSSNISYRISVIEYKDITVYEEAHSTKLLTHDGNVWMTDPEDVSDVLSSISITGGGDENETVVDALGLMLSDSLSFRNNASKFAILLTDAGYKTDNNYGYLSMDDLIDDLVEKGVNTSVISSTSLESTYGALYTETDGIFCDIYGNFADQLSALADHVREIVDVVKITLQTTEISRTDSTVQYSLSATVESTDEEKTAHNIDVELSKPEGSTLYGDALKTIAELSPKESAILSWVINVPVLEGNANYNWGVDATSEDFAVGVVCSAVDSFSVAGSGEQDYTWKFGEDNYSFTNSASAFGYKWWIFGTAPYYISETDLNAFLSQLSNTETERIADMFSAAAGDKTVKTQEKVQMLKNGELKKWEGSCYGMSLTAALFKVGILDPNDYGGDYTHDIPALDNDENSKLESMINVYQISQGTNMAINSSRLKNYDYVDDMWNKAIQIGKGSSGQQPYLVRLYDDDIGGHAVVCYGAEEGNYKFKGEQYSKRLLIADPNETSETYIYISDDFSKAVYSAIPGFTEIGYRDTTLSALNSYDYEDAMTNYKMFLSVKSKSELRITDGSAKAVFKDSKLDSSEGDIQIDKYYSDDVISDEETPESDPLFLVKSESDTFYFEPENGESVDFNVCFKDYSADIAGKTDKVVVGTDGAITLENAQGEVNVSLALNDSAFDFVTIKGFANGEVSLSVGDGYIDVVGDINNLEFINMDRDCVKTLYTPNDGLNKRIVFGENCIEIVADTDGDGVYETPQVFSMEEVPTVQRTVWHKGSREALKIKVDGTAEKVYVDGVLLTEGKDYSCEDSYIVLTVEFLETLSTGDHSLSIGNGMTYTFTVEE